jgi:hypothetical protein
MNVPHRQPNTLPLAGRDEDGVSASAKSSPFRSTGRQIPVTVITVGALPDLPPGTALLTIDSAGHDHAGAECLVCNTRGSVRVLLFELLEQARLGAIPPFASVIVDARHAADPQAVIDALIHGRLPAFGMRDHTVARSFQLAPE